MRPHFGLEQRNIAHDLVGLISLETEVIDANRRHRKRQVMRPGISHEIRYYGLMDLSLEADGRGRSEQARLAVARIARTRPEPHVAARMLSQIEQLLNPPAAR